VALWSESTDVAIFDYSQLFRMVTVPFWPIECISSKSGRYADVWFMDHTPALLLRPPTATIATTDVTKITTGLVEMTFLSHEFYAISRGPPPMVQTVRIDKINKLNRNIAHTQIRINARKSCTR